MTAESQTTVLPLEGDSARRALNRDISTRGLLRAAPLALRDMTLLLVMLTSATIVVFVAVVGESLGFDFRGTLWDAAVAVRNGTSPYPAPTDPEVGDGNPALYPPFLMLVVVPLTLLPWWLGLAVWTALQVAAIIGTLAVLRIRDVRCYALALISMPVVQGLAWGNAALLLVPLVALAWHWRDRWLRVGLVVGLAIAAKLFLWPLLLWLVGTRRYRAAVAASVAAAAIVLLPWAVIGFDGLTSYPDLLRVAERIYATHSLSTATVLAGLGLSPEMAGRGALAVGLVVAASALVAGRRAADETSIALAVLAAILGSPIVWEYYYTLLLVPIAIARPRLSGVWLILPLTHIAHRLPREQLARDEFELGGVACCRPEDVPFASWAFNHAPPALWPALGYAALAVAVVVLSARAPARVGRVESPLSARTTS